MYCTKSSFHADYNGRKARNYTRGTSASLPTDDFPYSLNRGLGSSSVAVVCFTGGVVRLLFTEIIPCIYMSLGTVLFKWYCFPIFFANELVVSFSFLWFRFLLSLASVCF